MKPEPSMTYCAKHICLCSTDTRKQQISRSPFPSHFTLYFFRTLSQQNLKAFPSRSVFPEFEKKKRDAKRRKTSENVEKSISTSFRSGARSTRNLVEILNDSTLSITLLIHNLPLLEFQKQSCK